MSASAPSLLPFFRSTDQVIKSMNITPERGVGSGGNFATREEISGLQTVAGRRNSPDAPWRIFAPPSDESSLLPTYDFGDVGRNFRFFVKSSRGRVTEKSSSWGGSMPAHTKDFS